jgi:hypothetical protein
MSCLPPPWTSAKCKNVVTTAVPNSKSNSLLHDAPSPVLSPSCSNGGLEGGLLCRKDKPSWLRQISTSEVEDQGVRSKVVVVVRHIARALLVEFTQILPSFPTPANRFPLEESEMDVDMSRLNFRRLNFVPVSGGDIVS